MKDNNVNALEKIDESLPNRVLVEHQFCEICGKETFPKWTGRHNHLGQKTYTWFNRCNTMTCKKVPLYGIPTGV